jgi:hypothetical protein
MYPQGLYNTSMLGSDWATEAFYRKADWQLKFLLWPKRCDLSRKWLWLCTAYKGTAGWSGPGEPAYEYRYHDSQEHLIWKLKGN